MNRESSSRFVSIQSLGQCSIPSSVKRFERSEAIERLERLEPVTLMAGLDYLNCRVDQSLVSGISHWHRGRCMAPVL